MTRKSASRLRRDRVEVKHFVTDLDAVRTAIDILREKFPGLSDGELVEKVRNMAPLERQRLALKAVGRAVAT